MKVIVVLCLLAACTYAQQLPPFLQGAPPNIVAEFRQMLSGANQQTDAQMEQQIEAWANRQSPQIRMSFQQFKQQMLAAVQQAEAQHQAVLARLSPAARQADLQLMAIAKHQGLTGGQKQAQIQQLLYSLSPAVKQELQRALQG